MVSRKANIFPADLSPGRDGPSAHLLAGAAILRLGSGSCTPRILFGTYVPSSRGRGDKGPSETLACVKHRLCGGFWRVSHSACQG